MTARVLLEARDVTVRFGRVTAVEGVTMAVHEGEIVGLLGANGAGKTTLIRALLGLLAPVAGTTRLLGGPPDHGHRRRLGYMPQGLGLYADLTVTENVRFVAGAYGVAAPDLPPELAAVADRLVGGISLGLQRRLAFNCALLHDPEVLILDEPTSAVGPLGRADLWHLIHRRAADGVGVLVTTHIMAEAQQCDRLLLLSDGRLVGQGSEADIIAGTTAARVDCADWAAAFAVLDAAGEPVTLAGRAVRVANSEPSTLADLLARHGIAAQVVAVPATIEERMTILARAAAPGR